MGFLRRLLGLDRATVAPVITGAITANVNGLDDQLAIVTIGGVSVPSSVWEGYQRDIQDWSSGIRLMDPETGAWLREDDLYPAELLAAGARSIAVAGTSFHPESQSPAFAVGSIVRLVPESHPKNPRAISIRSHDGRLMAGYVPNVELERVHALTPRAVVGLIVWENYTWRPRRRIGIRLVIGPSVRVDLVDPRVESAERARRESAFQAGSERQHQAREEERERIAARRADVTRASRLEQDARTAARASARVEKALLETERRAAGVCVICGGPIEPQVGRSARPARCAACRTGSSPPRW